MLSDDLVRVVREAVQPEHASLWLRQPKQEKKFYRKSYRNGPVTPALYSGCMSYGEKRGKIRMRLSTLIRWGGPMAIVSGVFTMFSDYLGLTIYVPGLGETANTGYQAVGSGVILFALTLLIVGMMGLYAGQPKPSGARVIEYGDGHARYVLAEVEEPRPAEPTGERARPSRSTGARVASARRHRTARREAQRA